MRPIDSVTKRIWDGDNCNVIMDQIRREVDAELRARDVHRGIPEFKDIFDDDGVKIGVKPNFQVYVDDGKAHFAIDRHLASLRHTGRERRLMIQRRWLQFCAEPRDEGILTADASLIARREELARMLERTREVEASDNSTGAVKSTPDLPMPGSDTDIAEFGEPVSVSVVDVAAKRKPFACDQCDRSFAKKNHLANHKKSHARETVGV